MITSRHTPSARAVSFFLSLLVGVALGTVAPPVFAGTVAQVPLFLVNSAKPLVMLDMSKDHQLFYKAYDDYSDLTGDGTPETTYKHSVDYYGYFDSYKCYSYSTNRFEPQGTTADKYCSSQWSGNFLNWASMARIDTVRKILYGGYRSTDSSTDTVLERAYLPNDAHSFAKYYNGSDVDKLTPFTTVTTGTTQTDGITLCNTTLNTAGAYSQTVTDPPLIRVAKGNYALWAANERWQCRWFEEWKTTGFGGASSNGNDPAVTGINAANDNPSKTSNGLKIGSAGPDYFTRVQVCKSGLIGKEDCTKYPDGNYKPIGLLQTYGDDDQLYFGLMTGSYVANRSGGVLRKNIGSMTDEVNVTTDGTFKAVVPTGGGIVNTLNKLRLYGYSHNNGVYNTGDNCSWGLASFTNGSCTNWGNPQSEIFLESLRYLCGKNPTAAFNASDTGLPGLTTATWKDPLSDTNYCAPLTIIDFNASVSSYDGDELSGASDLNTSTTASQLTNAVGDGEGITDKSYFVGRNGTNNDQLCTSKTVPGLGTVDGTCPQAPRLLGTYQIAGLAYHANIHDLRSLQKDQKVKTYGVALSPAVPQITIPVPGSSTKTVTILPACRSINNSTGNLIGNCAIVDFKIVQPHTVSGGTGTGKLYINWEDSEQGGDYDQDMAGVLSYAITGTTVQVTTRTVVSSTPYRMGFGYTIGGTTKDGFHSHSGINSFAYTDPTSVTGCTACTTGAAATFVTYTLGASSAGTLQQPLWYASKWGGFTVDTKVTGDDKPDLAKKWDSNADGIPDNYFYATDPAQLAKSLGQVFLTVQQTTTSAASVATNSVTYQTGTRIYQGQFDSSDWSGDLLSYSINSDGSVATSPSWSAASILATTSAGSRQIVTYDPSAPGTIKGVPFVWANLNATQKGYLNTDPVTATTDTKGQDRLDYLRGDHSKEQVNSGTFRNRSKVLGHRTLEAQFRGPARVHLSGFAGERCLQQL